MSGVGPPLSLPGLVLVSFSIFDIFWSRALFLHFCPSGIGLFWFNPYPVQVSSCFFVLVFALKFGSSVEHFWSFMFPRSTALAFLSILTWSPIVLVFRFLTVLISFGLRLLWCLYVKPLDVRLISLPSFQPFFLVSFSLFFVFVYSWP